MTIPIGKAIDKMLRKIKIETTVRQWEVVSLWGDIVGETIAKHTRAEKISFGKLYVSVDSPAWRNELMFQKKDLLKKVNCCLKRAKIKEIVLR
jgi:predicted nucleic acid-binding Zn ribbon protein